MSGAKTIENRPRPTAYRGPLLVHAGLRRAWGGRSCAAWADRFGVAPHALAPGAIVGLVDVVDCVPLAQLAVAHPSLDGDAHAVGPWCWILADPRRLPERVPMRGQLGLYRPPEPAASRVLACMRPDPRPIIAGGAA